MAPKLEVSGVTLNFTVQPTVAGRRYQLQTSATFAGGTWQNVGAERIGDGNPMVISTPYDPAVRQRFYWVVLYGPLPPPPGFSYIPAGSYRMGDQSSPRVGFPDELPVHSVSVSAFYMGQTEVTKAQWNEVRIWGVSHGYTDLATGGGKASNHPVQRVKWFDMVKWCNARSEKENLIPCYQVAAVLGGVFRTGQYEPACDWAANGYRLPTEAEWEKAARGGLTAQNFPWGNTISHAQANYGSYVGFSYDISPTRGDHPDYAAGTLPYTSPVGSFAANGYGLYDAAGNVSEACWDWHDQAGYPSGSQSDPRGPASGSDRVARGSSWRFVSHLSAYTRVSCRGTVPSTLSGDDHGFRISRSRL